MSISLPLIFAVLCIIFIILLFVYKEPYYLIGFFLSVFISMYLAKQCDTGSISTALCSFSFGDSLPSSSL